jgi:hypothetical protein
MMEGPRDPLPPHKAAHLAFETMSFALQLSTLRELDRLRPEMFPKRIHLAGTSVTVEGKVSASGLKAKLDNLVLGAVAVAAQGMDCALQEAYGPRPLDKEAKGGIRKKAEDLSDLEAAREIVYMMRCAVSHNPFRPMWECRGPRLGRFSVTAIALVVDTTTLDSKPFDLVPIGGFDGYVNLMRFCRHELRRLIETGGVS